MVVTPFIGTDLPSREYGFFVRAASGRQASYLIDARGMIRFAHKGWDETAVATYRHEIMSLLAEWRDAPNPN